ncbi:MAG: efflux transporter outer membrane subunit [Proteobacteria bacterium]|nr:efflux transporter outer membrane subunit [Pseudomonadota bacterium]
MNKLLHYVALVLVLGACTVGPDYQRPKVLVPTSYKEAPAGWKIASPNDSCDRGPWWLVFEDPLLNDLINELNISNENIIAASAQYCQAKALVSQARAAFFPVLSSTATFTRQQLSGASGSVDDVRVISLDNSNVVSPGPVFNDYNLSMSVSWEPDIWGGIRRSVESSVAGAQSSAALLAATRLLAQAQLAQFYFELRGLDGDQRILDNTVKNYQRLLNITTNQYKQGTVGRSNILAAKSQLELAQVAAIDNGILRAQYEHAIAVLIGKPPANFCIKAENTLTKVPSIPIEIPSNLLERRPDIAQYERLVAQANAQIGVAISAYFPVLSLTGTGGYESSLLENLFSRAAKFWSLGASLAETIFDGGLRGAQVDAARATYDQVVANYRQTVLAAFQDVEDNLVALNTLDKEISKQQQAVATAREALSVVLNEYSAGTVAISDVLNAELTLYTAEKGANDINYRRLVSAVGLIRSLGGGWISD